MIFPIKDYIHILPTSDDVGGFGHVRKFDTHTGIDLYCQENDDVYAISDGEVVNIIEFTGFKESPWWNDTYAILIYHQTINKTFVYGELIPANISIGSHVQEGDIIGNVKTVLKKQKSTPTNMLHVELLDGLQKEVYWWHHNQEKPIVLLNPYDLLKNILTY